MSPEEDPNIDVRCMKCGTQYTTSTSWFNEARCRCPICQSAKTERLADG